MNLNQITYTEINQLDAVQLSEVLLTLLHAEAKKFQFNSLRQLIVPLRINVADGGEDGRLDCSSTNGSTYIHNPLSYFQCKATEIAAKAIAAELFAVDKDAENPGDPPVLEFKKNVEEVLTGGGQYLMFIGHDYNPKLRKLRLLALQQGLDRYNQLHGTNFLPDQVRIMESNEIAGWVNQFIHIVVRVQEMNKIHRLMGLQTINQLGSLRDISETPYHSNETLEQFMQQIRSTSVSAHASLRIIGHSGLGKTRLVYEAFKGEAYNGVLYYRIVDNPQEIINFITTYGTGYEGTIIVDNCEYSAHKQLKQLIERTTSKFQLITVDFNVSEESDSALTESYITLKQYMFKDIVKQILKDEYENKLDIAQIDQVAEFAEGYPGMAVLFANARLKGTDNFSALLDEELIHRLAFGRDWNNKDKDKLNLLKACSVFTNFLKPDRSAYDILTEVQKQQSEAQRNFITCMVCRPPQETYVFEETVDYFIRNGVMERRGHYLLVKPTPLAIRLATEWWKYTDEQQLKNIFDHCEQLGLSLPLINRLSQLGELSHAARLARTLWGADSPFGSAEVLNTYMGSRIIRSVAQVNPESAMETLQKVFGSLTIEELKGMGPGRRNILWTLEVLVFRKEFFDDAARLMLRFALAENENISNNATGQFLHLFHVILPGTEADLKQRLKLIDELLGDETKEVRHFGLRALYSALTADGFRRDGGAESQGEAAPLVDFYPTWAQSADYWMAVIDRLVSYVQHNPEILPDVKAIVSRYIRWWFKDRMPFLVEKSVTEFFSVDPSLWTDAISQLNTSVEYEQLDQADMEIVDRLLLLLKPQKLEDEFRYYVSKPVWNYPRKQEDEYIDHTGIAAANFAERLVNEKIDLQRLLPLIVSGEQLKSYQFGRKLGELVKSTDLAIKMLDTLQAVDEKNQNPEIIAAYISALDERARISLYEIVLRTDKLKPLAFYFARAVELPFEEIVKLFDLVNEGAVDISAFYQFTWGRGLHQLSDQEVKTLYEQIATYSDGVNLAFELAFEFMGRSDERWALFKPFYSKIIREHNLLLNRGRNSDHNWHEVVKRLIEEDGVESFTKLLVGQLLEATAADHISSYHNYASAIFHELVERDFKNFWKAIAPSILTNDYINLRFFMSSHNGNMPYSGLLNKADIPTLVEWCKKNSELGLLRVARIMPVTPAGDPNNWHPLAKALIDNFGNSEKLLQEISSNIGSFGSVGSRVPYLRNQQTLVAKLESHPIAKVAKWAKAFVKHKETEIRQTIAEEQAHYLNF
jgi:hypothetical protein